MRSVLLLLAVMLATAGCPAALAQDGVSNKYVTIPLFYLTDRAASKKAKTPFTGQRKFEDGTAIYNLHTGTLDCSTKNSLKKAVNSKRAELGWRESSTKQELVTNPLVGSGEESAIGDFAKVIAEAGAKSESKEVFVIVHGFNTSFKEAAESAAKLAYSVERPVVVFDWPSKGKVTQYDVDACNNEWSQEHFNQFLDELGKVKAASGVKFNLVAHSMGNRLAVRSAPVLKGQHLFKEIFLVDPDFDAETFVHYLIRYAVNAEKKAAQSTAGGADQKPTRVRVLFSHKDKALPLAQCLFGGYTRLGQAADSMLSSLMNPLSAAELLADTGKRLTGDDSDSEKDANEAKTVSKACPDWLLKFEWIDFTALDHGIIGHTIPFELVANLNTNDEPGDGLRFVDGANNAPNGLSRLFLGLFHQKEHISSRLGTCKRVVIVKDEKQKLAEAGLTK